MRLLVGFVRRAILAVCATGPEVPSRSGYPFIQICSLEEARDADLRGYAGVITIEDSLIEYPFRLDSLETRQLVLRFDDITADPVEDYLQPLFDECILASEAHVRAALSFARKCGETSLLIHCHAGMSRSPAIGLAILADWLGEGYEAEAVKALLRIARLCTPNKLVIEIADRVLRRQGKLISVANHLCH